MTGTEMLVSADDLDLLPEWGRLKRRYRGESGP